METTYIRSNIIQAEHAGTIYKYFEYQLLYVHNIYIRNLHTVTTRPTVVYTSIKVQCTY